MTEAVAKYFSAAELRCKCEHCKGVQPHQCPSDALGALDELRAAYGSPLSLNSAYRCPKHPVEASKPKPGTHGQGIAFDIRVTDGAMAYQIMQIAFAQGWNGIALGNGFVHVDRRETTPVTWKY